MELDLPAGFDPDKDEVYLLQEKRNGNNLMDSKDAGYKDYNYRANLGSTLRKVSVKEPEAWPVDTDLGGSFDTYGTSYYRFEDKNSERPLYQ